MSEEIQSEQEVSDSQNNEAYLDQSSDNEESQDQELQGEETLEAQASDDTELINDELDHIADVAIAALEDMTKYFDLGEVTIDEYEGDEGELILDITGDDMAVLIGRHGKTLDAIQFLISLITARNIGYRFPVIVDVEGYKGRQREKVEQIAQRAADRAVDQDREIKLRPMLPYERRWVHIALRDDAGVYTESAGEGSRRHVVVYPRH